MYTPPSLFRPLAKLGMTKLVSTLHALDIVKSRSTNVHFFFAVKKTVSGLKGHLITTYNVKIHKSNGFYGNTPFY